MFRPGNKTPDLPDSVREAGVADGFVYVCSQGALIFGSNRKLPKPSRPVVAIKPHGERLVVLPCTTRDQRGSAEFFDLDEKQRVTWVNQVKDKPHSFAYYRYELIDSASLQKKAIGMMAQPHRIELLNWLKSRY